MGEGVLVGVFVYENAVEVGVDAVVGFEIDIPPVADAVQLGRIDSAQAVGQGENHGVARIPDVVDVAVALETDVKRNPFVGEIVGVAVVIEIRMIADLAEQVGIV